MNTVKNNIHRDFTTIPNALINDTTIDKVARFLFVFMASKPDDWKFWNEELCAGVGVTDKTLLKYMNILIKSGWISREQVRSETGEFSTYNYTLRSYPDISPEGKIYRTVKIPSLQRSISIKGESKKEKNSKREVLDDPETIQRLAEEFPLADVPREIKKMKNWLDAEGKTKKNYYAFAANWLDRASGKKVNTDAALNDEQLSQEQAELYEIYIKYVLDHCPELWKSETRVLTKAEYKAYLEDTNTPNLAIYITSREKSDLMANVHRTLDRDKFARERNRTVFEAYLKSVQSVIHKTPARL